MRDAERSRRPHPSDDRIRALLDGSARQLTSDQLTGDQRLMLILGQISAWLYLACVFAAGVVEKSAGVRNLAILAIGVTALSQLMHISGRMTPAMVLSVISWAVGATAGILLLVLS